MSLSFPAPFGRYELVERLAVGGMAELFKARVVGSHGFQKPVVIKQILPHLSLEPSLIAMFIDEAKITALLDHPKIAQVLDLGTVDDRMYIAMEFIDGPDVLGLLRSSAARHEVLPVPVAVHIAAEVLDALDYAHHAHDVDGTALSIVHRDISPANVLISRRGDVKLTDFGIAHAVEHHHVTKVGTLKGKYGYMSPEQAVAGVLDGRSDLFAVGVVLAEMLMGRRLFAAASDLDVLLMVRDVDLARLSKYGGAIEAELRAIVLKALRRDPDDRYPSAAAFRDVLHGWLSARDLRVGPPELAAIVEAFTQGEASTLVPGPDGAVASTTTTSATLAGPTTQAKALQAEELLRRGRAAADQLRAALESDELRGDDLGIELDRLPTRAPRNRARSTPPSARLAPGPRSTPAGLEPVDAPPDREGDLGLISPIHVLYRLAVDQADGLLIVDNAAVSKQIYLIGGTPESVSSSATDELLGEHLVTLGVISAGELAMALAMMPHFGGKLGDSLVGLGLLRPIEVFRHLTRQVRDKLIGVCTWTQGHFRWFGGRRNPREAFPLGLDAFEVLGAGASRLAPAAIDVWMAAVGPRVATATKHPRLEPEAFRLGGYPRAVHSRLGGHLAVGELAARFTDDDQRLAFLRTLYLLVQTELAALT